MPWGALAGAVATKVLNGKSGGGGQSTQKVEIDPRIEPYIYGKDGKGGLLGNVNDVYQQQLLTNGLNPMQTAGLEMQRQALLSPETTRLWDMQRQAGASLMGGGVAPNPFSAGVVGPGGIQSAKLGAMPSWQLPQQPGPQVNYNAAATPIAQALPPPTKAPMTEGDIESLVMEYLKNNPLAPAKPEPELWNGG